MADYLVRCTCGKETRVSEWAIGAPLTCPACGKILQANEKNARLIEERKAPAPPPEESALPPPPEARIAARSRRPSSSRPVPAPAAPLAVEPETPAAPAPTVNRKNCGKCGRAFRGDWDMHHRGGLILCHICANQYRNPGEEPAAPAAGTPAAAPPSATPVAPIPVAPAPIDPSEIKPRQYRGVLDHPVLPDPDIPSAGDIQAQDEQFRRYVIVAGICVVAFVAIMLLTGTPDGGAPPPAPPEAGEATAPPASSLPSGIVYLIHGLAFAFEVLTTATVLHFLLDWRDKLPKDTFVGNALSLGLVAGVVEGLGVLLNVVPCAGLLLQPLLALYILRELYDLEWADLVMLGLFFALQNPLMLVLRTALT